MKRTKKIVTLALAAMLLVSSTVAVTMAYLTSTTEVAKNTFTVGKVKITLDEADVNEYGELLYKTNVEGKLVASEEELSEGEKIEGLADRVLANEYKLIPGHSYVKDPTVHVAADSEESYIRMIVTISDIADVKEVLGTAGDHFEVDPKIAGAFLPQLFVEGWNPEVWVSTGEIIETNDTAVYEFRYYKTVSTADLTAIDLPALFTDIVVPESIANEDLAKLEELEINVIAHAMQTDGFESAEDAWAAFE